MLIFITAMLDVAHETENSGEALRDAADTNAETLMEVGQAGEGFDTARAGVSLSEAWLGDVRAKASKLESTADGIRQSADDFVKVDEAAAEAVHNVIKALESTVQSVLGGTTW